MRNLQPVRVLRQIGFRLQLPLTETLADHVPIAAEANFVVEHTEKTQRPLPRSLVDALTDEQDEQSWTTELNQWATSEIVQNAASIAKDTGNPDMLWEVVNGALEAKMASRSSDISFLACLLRSPVCLVNVRSLEINSEMPHYQLTSAPFGNEPFRANWQRLRFNFSNNDKMNGINDKQP